MVTVWCWLISSFIAKGKEGEQGQWGAESEKEIILTRLLDCGSTLTGSFNYLPCPQIKSLSLKSKVQGLIQHIIKQIRGVRQDSSESWIFFLLWTVTLCASLMQMREQKMNLEEIRGVKKIPSHSKTYQSRLHIECLYLLGSSEADIYHSTH